MATLREIRKKLHSVENIKKITQAMEMVAASRLRHSQAKTENSRPFIEKLKKVLNQMILSTPDLKHPLIEGREKNKIGVVVIAGDRGLCGSYNNNVLVAASNFLKQYSLEQVELFLIGQKAVNHFQSKKWNIKKRIVEWGGRITFNEIKALTNELIHEFLIVNLDEIWVVHTHFQNIMTQKVVIEKLLNIEVTPNEKEESAIDYILEPNAEEILNEIFLRWVLSKMQLMLNEAYTSELASRILAMRAATKNADEMIEELTLVRNKVRQTGITRELIEITAGAINTNL